MATPSNASQTVTLDLQPLLTPISIVVSSIFISIAIVVAGLIISNGLGGAKIGTVAGTADTPVADNGGTAAPTIVTTSMDDDARLGDRNAKVAIVEFSDYECPFCKQFKDQTLSQIKTNYIDKGLVQFTYRDLPLSFHDPAATYAANIMECTREAGGDQAYFNMHDWWFANSAINGGGVSDKNKIVKAIDSLGMNGGNVVKCADDGKFTTEIQADASDAAAIGVNGTPGFVVGTVDANGNVTGEVISGAYPYAEFERVINKYL